MMLFECVECGHNEPKWLGRCPVCRTWDSFLEKNEDSSLASAKNLINSSVSNLSVLSFESSQRILLGWKGFDRLLGGGLVPGEVLLFAGPPGVGKSTFFLQLAEHLSSRSMNVLFVSGEESPEQLKLHADRLGLKGTGISVISIGDLSILDSLLDELEPSVVFVDSIQAVSDPEVKGSPGSISQVKGSCQKIVAYAKNHAIPFVVSGQITKAGEVAGPKLLEHMVDAVFYMDYIESNMRIVTAAKNRFGSCGDFVSYKLLEEGLVEHEEESLLHNDSKVSGQANACVSAGNRLLLLEMQALVSPSYFEYPFRRTSGYSRERLMMLIAILEKNVGLKLSSLDVYLNVIGGNSVVDRQSDLAVAAAVFSSVNNIAVPADMLFVGELGLSGTVKTRYGTSEMSDFSGRYGIKRVAGSLQSRTLNKKMDEIYVRSVCDLKAILNKE